MKALGEAAGGLFIWVSTADTFISESAFKFECLRDLITNMAEYNLAKAQKGPPKLQRPVFRSWLMIFSTKTNGSGGRWEDDETDNNET